MFFLLLFARILFLFLIYIYCNANSAHGELSSDRIKRSGVRNSIKTLKTYKVYSATLLAQAGVKANV